jgi:glutamate dehydrogenase/leucine dehydrogenase
MSFQLLHAMSSAGFEEVVAVCDPASGLRAFIGLHDTTRGPAFGGVRRLPYREEGAALSDCLRLARAMTHKCIWAELPAGGAKTVLLDHPDLDREAAYRALGRAVERLGGRYYTGPDVGTGDGELGWLCEGTRYATRPDAEGPRELAEATAEGVFAGIGTALRHLDRETDWARRRVVVQGLGAVGARLARRLVEAGAHVIASDVDGERAQACAKALELEQIEPGEELSVDCDVFSPNALGGVIHDLSIERLRARIVAGGANNVLSSAVHARRLAERGVLFLPDFVINSGALIRGALFHLEGVRVPLHEIGLRVSNATAKLLALSGEFGTSPAETALQEAERRLAADRARHLEANDPGSSGDPRAPLPRDESAEESLPKDGTAPLREGAPPEGR